MDNDCSLFVTYPRFFTTYDVLYYHIWVSTYLKSRHNLYKYVLIPFLRLFLRKDREQGENSDSSLS